MIGCGEKQGSRLNPANKTLCAEGCTRRKPSLALGAPALLGPLPPFFCLYASLGVEAGGSGAELVQRRRLQSSKGWWGWGAGIALPTRNPSEATSSSTSTRCTLPTPFLSIALKNRRAFAGAWAEKELPSSAPAGRSLGRAGVDGGSQPTENLGWEGCATAPSSLQSEAPGRWDLRAGRCFLPALGKRRSGRGASAGGSGARSQVRARRS